VTEHLPVLEKKNRNKNKSLGPNDFTAEFNKMSKE
jgi:hypothetical protein